MLKPGKLDSGDILKCCLVRLLSLSLSFSFSFSFSFLQNPPITILILKAILFILSLRMCRVAESESNTTSFQGLKLQPFDWSHFSLPNQKQHLMI